MSEEVAAGALRPDSRDRPARMRALLDAALDLFSSEGYANVSTRRIAERAGCSETLLFRYFGGKRGLLLAISGEFTDTMPIEPPPEAAGASLEDFLQQHILGVWAAMHRHARETRVLMAELVTDPDLAADFEKLHDGGIAALERSLRRYHDSGEIAKDTDLHGVATAVEGIAFSLAFVDGLLYGLDRARIVPVAALAAHALTHGLAGEPAADADATAAADRRRGAALVRDAVGSLENALSILDPKRRS